MITSREIVPRVVREEGLSAIIVEPNPRMILGITHKAVVLDRGAVAHEASSAELLRSPDVLERLLAVSD